MEARKEEYSLNPHQHVRIWFSSDKNIFLPSENCLRLIKMRNDNPDDKIIFIYDKRLLSKEANQQLQTFCEKHRISAVDLQEIKTELSTDLEKELMVHIEEEILRTVSHTGGNFAAASDILRWCSPVFTRGIFSSFDTTIVTKDLPETVPVKAPFLVSIGNVVTLFSDNLHLYADILGIPNADGDHHASQLAMIAKIQKLILENYQTQDLSFAKLKRSNVLNSLDQGPRSIKNINTVGGSTIYEIRESIQQLFAAEEAFINIVAREILGTHSKELGCSTEEAIQSGNHTAALKTFVLAKLHEQLDQRPEFSNLSDEAFLEQCRVNLESAFLMPTRYQQTGNAVIAAALINPDDFRLIRELDNLQKFAWSSYKNLSPAFHSAQHIKFGMSYGAYLDRLVKAQPGTLCDASWVPYGQKIAAEREEKMQASAKLIQMWGRKHLERKHEKQQEVVEDLPALTL